MSGAIAGTVFSRAVILSGSHQKNLFRRIIFKKFTPTPSVVGNIANVAKICLTRDSSQFLPRAGGIKSLCFTNLFRRARDIYGSLRTCRDRQLCSSATEEDLKQKAPEEKVVIKKSEISFEELLTFVNSQGKYIFDVRDPSEVVGTGMLPNAINLPLTKLKASMLLSDNEFQQMYKVKKPSIDDSHLMVFYGLSSVKSSAALEIVHKLGYKKARHYPGGFEEWRLKMASK